MLYTSWRQKQGQLTKEANRKKNTKYVYIGCWPRIAWLWSHWVVLCYALIGPSPHIPQNPFPSSNRGLVLVVWIMFGRVGADMALGHGWCTMLFLGNNEKLPPMALNHRRTTAMLPEERWLAQWYSLAFSRKKDEQQHRRGFFTWCETFWSTGCPSNLKYLVKLVLVYLNACAKRDCQMLWFLWAPLAHLALLLSMLWRKFNWELILLVLKKHDI